MDGQTIVNTSGAAEAVPSGETGTAAPTVQPGAGAPASVAPSNASVGTSEPRTFRDEDVQRIVRERLADQEKKYAPWKDLGDVNDVRARLEKAERYEKALRGDEPKGPSPEERELRELLTKQFPGIDKVRDIEAKLQAMESASQASHAKAGRDIIGKMTKEKFGTEGAEDLESMENLISASIAKDPESLKAWNSGDVSVIAKHFEKVSNASMFKHAAALYSAGKAKDKAEVPPKMPQGGVQAPSSTDRKMNGEERRDAAWKRMQESAGQA